MARSTQPGPSVVIAGRIARCRRQMKKYRIGAYLVTNPMDYFYLTGFTGEDSAVLILPRAVHVLSDGRFDEAINQDCPWVTRWLRRGNLNSEIAKVSKELKLRSAAIQPEHLTLADHAEIRKRNRSTRLILAPPIVSTMRRLKEEVELEKMGEALRVAEEAFLAVRETIRLGETELELAARIEYEMKKRGASGASFTTICAEGANAALPHAHPGDRAVQSGSAILFDWGARVGFYCSDLTRMIFIDTITAPMGDVYGIVLEAQQRAIAALRPGRKMCDVDAIARSSIADQGYGEQFTHGLGHGLGLNVHEAPSLSWRSEEKLVSGMVVTVEPGIYLPGVGGVRIEDDVLITPDGYRVLSRLDKTLEGAVVTAIH